MIPSDELMSTDRSWYERYEDHSLCSTLGRISAKMLDGMVHNRLGWNDASVPFSL
jgi:hypothetical protein